MVPGGLYQWKALPFGLKTTPSIFHQMMDKIFRKYKDFVVTYIDDILVYSSDVNKHLVHLEQFYNLVKQNGLILSDKKIEFCKSEVMFLGVHIKQGTVNIQEHIFKKVGEFSDVILEKTQLQRFLGCMNYVSGYYNNIAEDRNLFNKRLQKDPPPWSQRHTEAVKRIKEKCKTLPALRLPGDGQKIVQIDASERFWGAILKEKVADVNGKFIEQICRYCSRSFTGAKLNYHSTHKEILAVIKAIKSFLLYLISEKFIVKSYLKNLKSFMNRKIDNAMAQTRLLRWSLFLESFDIIYDHVPGEKNSEANFLIREFQNQAK